MNYSYIVIYMPVFYVLKKPEHIPVKILQKIT